ncbi:MAG TPA: regulatory protein GemA [Pasteurella multocida]|nr:regulatory protein GemA [Pasteurella multocida]
MHIKLIQLIHIGKQQLGMDEETYRSLLKQQFGKSSSKDLKESELRQLIVTLQQKGATIRRPQMRTILTPLQRKLWAVWKSTADEATNNALNAYVVRMGVDIRWNKLNNQQASFVLETLKQWQKRKGEII